MTALRRSELAQLLHRARYELACVGCHNVGSIMTRLGRDECPECKGEKRNEATIELLEQLTTVVDQIGGKGR